MHYVRIKRIFDCVGALILLVVLLPLHVLIALAVKVNSKGPVFFKQERLGLNGSVFSIFKYRTMVVGAEKMGDGIIVREGDSRITKIGGILRRTSLDELPQIINILRGEMSFIGPRPPVPYHPMPYESYSAFQKKRFEVRPGITGLAQVTLRNAGSWDQRFQWDIKYIEGLSMTEDIKILFRTAGAVFSRRSIYREK